MSGVAPRVVPACPGRPGRRPARARLGGREASYPHGRCPKLSTRADSALHVHLSEMPPDGAGAQKELSTDLRVGKTVAGEPDNLLLLRCELVARLSAALPDGLAGRDQLSARALGESLHSNAGKLVGRRTKLPARVASSPLPPQPLPIEQLRAGELW